MKFKQPDDSQADPNPSKRVKDFSSRAVKIRLFLLVCGVMLVLVLMFEARKPENWQWMGLSSAEPEIDTRYLANIYGDPVSGDRSFLRASLGNQTSAEPRNQTLEPSSTQATVPRKKSEPTPKQDSQLAVAEKDFWDSVYKKLNYRQRMLLNEGLYLARQNRKLDEHQATEWLRIFEEFSIANDRYQADIIQFMSRLSEGDPERGQLSQTLFQLQHRWSEFEPVLTAIGNPATEQTINQSALERFQAVLDRTTLGFVEDNSLQSFTNDQPAMFRTLERIQTLKPGSTEPAEPPEKVLFSQMYKETDRLRGKTVSFEGEVRAGYAFQPTVNYLGIRKLYALWIQIPSAQNPVVVYTLNLPENFVVNLDEYSLESPAKLRESVRIVGILFQKMVYAAEDTQRIAPVVFTDTPIWSPRDEEDLTSKELPGMTAMFGSFLGIGAVLALVTWGFVSLNNRSHAKRIAELKQRFEKTDEDENAE